jgi:hypothetical protein
LCKEFSAVRGEAERGHVIGLVDGAGVVLLTHISQRYPAAEIAAEAARIFATVKVVADFDRFVIGPRASGTA